MTMDFDTRPKAIHEIHSHSQHARHTQPPSTQAVTHDRMGPTTGKGAAATCSSSLSEAATALAPAPAPEAASFGAFQEKARKATTEVSARNQATHRAEMASFN